MPRPAAQLGRNICRNSSWISRVKTQGRWQNVDRRWGVPKLPSSISHLPRRRRLPFSGILGETNFGKPPAKRQKPCLQKIKDYKESMTTKVTGKNMVSIPVAMARQFGIRPGYEFDWKPSRHPEEIIVRVIPDPRGLSRQLKGAGARVGGRRSAVTELIRERAEETS